MEGTGHFPAAVQLILQLYEAYLFHLVNEFIDYFLQLQLLSIEMLGLILELYVRSGLFKDIGGPESEPGTEDRVEGLQEVQTVNPAHKPVEFHIYIHTAFLTGKIVVSVAALQIEAYPFIILPVPVIILFYGIIHQLILLPDTVGADEATTAQEVKNLFTVLHKQLILNGIHKGIFYI